MGAPSKIISPPLKSAGFFVNVDGANKQLRPAFMLPSGDLLKQLLTSGEDGLVRAARVLNGPEENKGAVLTVPSLKPGAIAPLRGCKLVFPGFIGLGVPAGKMVGRMRSEVEAETGDRKADVYQEGDCVSVTLSVDSDDEQERQDFVCGTATAFVRALEGLREERGAHALVFQVSGCGGFGRVYADPLATLSVESKVLKAKLKASRKLRIDARALELREHAEAAKKTCASVCGLIAIAVDCEMVRGQDGRSLLARMSLVGMRNNNYDDDNDPPRLRIVLLDVYVRPDGEVHDYLTHVSGITQHHIEGNPDALPFRVARDLFIDVVARDSSTLLVGHGLANDLAALRVPYEELECEVSDSATDPACLRDSGHADSLRNLCRVHLDKVIQASGMHCSVEDAWDALCLRFKLVERGELGLEDCIEENSENDHLLLLAALLEGPQ